jgi:fatty acid desaturase
MHTEHHDFHYVPWFRLGRLRQIAPEYYVNLKQTRSFSKLAFQFAFGTRDAFNNEEQRNRERLSRKLELQGSAVPPPKSIRSNLRKTAGS